MKFCFKDDQPYCVNDFDRLFGKTCTGMRAALFKGLMPNIMSVNLKYTRSKKEKLRRRKRVGKRKEEKKGRKGVTNIFLVCGGLLEGPMLGNPEGGFLHVECLTCCKYLYFKK